MGTGGGNVPMVMEKKVIALDRASFNQGENAKYDFEISDSGVNSTLVAKGPGAVCYEDTLVFDNAQITSKANGNNPQWNDPCHTLCSWSAKDATVIIKPQYIVRRLTPTECARLQGFPDKWGHIIPKEDFTDEEYAFWCKVNVEYALIQGTIRPDEEGWYDVWREVKPNKKKGDDFEPYWENTGKKYTHKTKPQMIKWYNKLHIDSAEYKMWGNGIALPCALYVMEGIADALKKKRRSAENGEHKIHNHLSV
jgi:DNA (cytosine-5)-methyltransferase 1